MPEDTPEREAEKREQKERTTETAGDAEQPGRGRSQGEEAVIEGGAAQGPVRSD
jgi:hypothetical protein